MSDYEPGEGYPDYYNPHYGERDFSNQDILNLVPSENPELPDFGSFKVVSFKSVTIPLNFSADYPDGKFVVGQQGVVGGGFYGATFNADVIKLTQGNDSFGTFEGSPGVAVYGGGGNDGITSGFYSFNGLYMDGGSGNDTLEGDYAGRDRMLGDTGNDVLIVTPGHSEGEKGDKATGGPGADSFVFGNLDQNNGDGVFITDFNPGQGDTVDLRQSLGLDGYYYASFADAIAAGAIGVKYDHGYTYLSFDQNGDHVPEFQFAYLKGVFTSSTFDHFLV